MSKHRATIIWNRGSADFSYETYSRDHTWEFENGIKIEASAAPGFRGTPENVDPEEAYVAALSSCHMLTFLAIAVRRRLVIDSYTDSAIGYLEKNDLGKLSVTRVTLRPKVSFENTDRPPAEELEKLHHLAHKECFIANSVQTEISIESQ
jgi:organic hydroperoxide reductase OsmC/OhrA